MCIILQAYTGVSDDEAIEAIVMDRRWQLVLDCLDCEIAPFGKGTLVRFRAGLIAGGGDRSLIERTIEIASKTQEYNLHIKNQANLLNLQQRVQAQTSSCNFTKS